MIETNQSLAAHVPALEAFCTDTTLSEMLDRLVPTFQREGGEVQPDYSANFRFGDKGYSPDGVYWDTRCGIRLAADGLPVGCVGFIPFGGSVTIKQLQGIFFLERIPPLRWERLLVTLLGEVTQAIGGYSSLCIVSADKIEWYNGPNGVLSEDELSEHKQRMRRRYDGTARALKFRKNGGLWEKSLGVG